MNDPTQDDKAPATTTWGATDALLLEGLSGLDRGFSVSRTEDRPQETENSVQTTNRTANLDATVDTVPLSGFRSARELRAEQEKIAAKQRSAVRRKGGVTQALGLNTANTPAARQAGPDPKPTPKPVTTKAPPSSVTPAASSSTPRVSNKSRPLSAPKRKDEDTPIITTRKPQQRPPADAPITANQPPQTTRSNASPASRPVNPQPREPLPASSRTEPALRIQAHHSELEPVVRRRRTSSSFLPSVVTSLLLTSLVWAALLYTAWHFIGNEWVSEKSRPKSTR